MLSRAKVPYVKEKTGRVLSGGGPRDAQRRGRVGTKQQVLAPQIDIEALKKTIADTLNSSMTSSGVSIDQVDERVSTAVREAVESESGRYESGLNNLNEQLNSAKIKIALMNKEIEKRDTTILELQASTSSSQDAVLLQFEVQQLKATISERDDELIVANKKINALSIKSSNSNDDLIGLKDAINVMSSKITNLQTGGMDTTKSDAPSIDEHQVFINPSEDKGDLTSHIDIEATSVVTGDSDFSKSSNKLKDLLSKGTYKPAKAKLSKK